MRQPLSRSRARRRQFRCASTWKTRCTDGDASWIYTRRCAASSPQRIGVVLQSALRRTLDDVDRADPTSRRTSACARGSTSSRAGHRLHGRRAHSPQLRRWPWIGCCSFERGAYVGIATHDELLVWEALRLIRQHLADAPQASTSSRCCSASTSSCAGSCSTPGHRLRVYVPYGEHWYQYSVRRLRENPQLSQGLRRLTKSRDRSRGQALKPRRSPWP